MYLAKPEISNRWGRRGGGTEQKSYINIAFESHLNLAIRTGTKQYRCDLCSICHLTWALRPFLAIDNAVTERSNSREEGKLKD